MAMATPNGFGAFQDYKEIEIPLKLKGYRLFIRLAQEQTWAWYVSFVLDTPKGGSSSLPSIKGQRHSKEAQAFDAALGAAEDCVVYDHDISPANKKKISEAIKKAREEFQPNEPEEKQLMVIENEQEERPAVKRTALNDQQKIRSIRFEGDKCKIAYTTALGDDAAKHSVECKASMAFGLHETFVGVSLGFQVTGCADFNTTKIDFSYEGGELSYLSVEGLTELARPFAGHAQTKAADLLWAQIAKACPHVEDEIWDLLDETKQFLAGQRQKLQLVFDVYREVE